MPAHYHRNMSEESRTLRGKLASAGRDNPEAVEDLRRDFEAERLADHIRRLVAEAPPLTAEQKNRLAALLLRDAS
jgi:hypothetical protein